jgi:hypothetical protein
VTAIEKAVSDMRAGYFRGVNATFPAEVARAILANVVIGVRPDLSVFEPDPLSATERSVAGAVADLGLRIERWAGDRLRWAQVGKTSSGVPYDGAAWVRDGNGLAAELASQLSIFGTSTALGVAAADFAKLKKDVGAGLDSGLASLSNALAWLTANWQVALIVLVLLVFVLKVL